MVEVSDDHRKMAELKMGIPIKWFFELFRENVIHHWVLGTR